MFTITDEKVKALVDYINELPAKVANPMLAFLKENLVEDTKEEVSEGPTAD